MNYRHVYHAGNFADCMKHALLLVLLDAMRRKNTPFLVLDTHAGAGHYDISSPQAAKTNESQAGIARLREAAPPALSDYLATITKLGLYPGSPAITAAKLRPTDRLIACELHPEDAATLRRNLPATAQIAIHQRDGYAALPAFLPPPEKRALILIDPPFERADEFSVLAQSLIAAHKKFPTGIYAAWYPIKSRALARDFHETLKLSPIRDVITAELLRRPPHDPARLNGCGLLIINPPYKFAETASPILQALEDTLGEPGHSSAITTIIDE
jgi:23S rRNA (adenine2030-N6)-methyltransferase